MSQPETNQPLTELCERCWKQLFRHGKKRTTKKRSSYRFNASVEINDEMMIQVDEWIINSMNRHLFLRRVINVDSAKYEPVFSVDEEGEVGALDVVECARALEFFRQHQLLDDLADIDE